VVNCGHFCAELCDNSQSRNETIAANPNAWLDLGISIAQFLHGPNLAMTCRAANAIALRRSRPSTRKRAPGLADFLFLFPYRGNERGRRGINRAAHFILVSHSVTC
jgi:hypothetical protein